MQSLKKMGRLSVVIGIVALGVLTLAAEAWAQAFPTRPVEVIVPYPPGGASDLSVRFLADKWAEFLGQPVVVVNKPGAGAALGAKLAASAKPDGYTLLAGTDSPLLTVRFTQKDAGYDLDSFTYLFAYGKGALYFITKKDSRWKSLQDFTAEAKRRPTELTYASYGVGALTHFAAEMLWKAAGVKLTYVPYKSSPEAITAMLGGHVDMAVTANRGSLGKDETTRVLAIASDQRRPDALDVPTLKELGYPVSLDFLSVIVAPKGLPQDIRARLIAAHQKAYTKYRTEIEQGLLRVAELIPVTMDGETALKNLREREKWFRELAPQMGLAR